MLKLKRKKLIEAEIDEIEDLNGIRYPADIYMLKGNNRNTRLRCGICSKLTINNGVVLLSVLLTLVSVLLTYQINQRNTKNTIVRESISEPINQSLTNIKRHFLRFLTVNTIYTRNLRSSHPGVFLGKGVLNIWSKFTGEHPCTSVTSIKFLWSISIEL